MSRGVKTQMDENRFLKTNNTDVSRSIPYDADSKELPKDFYNLVSKLLLFVDEAEKSKTHLTIMDGRK